MGRPALAIGGIALIGAGIAVGFGWWNWNRTTAEVNREVSQQIRTVRFDVDSGDVMIQTGPVAATTIHQRFHYNRDAVPGDAFTVDGDELVLSDCGHNCSVDFEVTVPAGTAVTGELTSGDVRLRNTGPVDVSATSGDVDVSLRTAQDIRVRVTSGDVRVIVPPGRYHVSGSSTSGDRQIDVPTDVSGPVLDISTTSGDATVHTA
ncbi:DUF4097 family beta strand repeat-containing protein [Amycolatopsis taiwanensis]|uniref:DUF4097 family beta strand repeat-containing protein n=1 Tax=Amycolatopsis taiwanensis TaxID=342230 RepID=UPI000482DA76|nr:DUF4097 family beta strand repeat-containing protein [Amycolatopsis taiwanensis]